jgi:hypothetical protein
MKPVANRGFVVGTAGWLAAWGYPDEDNRSAGFMAGFLVGRYGQDVLDAANEPQYAKMLYSSMVMTLGFKGPQPE